MLVPASAAFDDTSELSKIVVTVEGAGAVEVNGQYRFTKMLDGAAMFGKLTLYLDKPVTFFLYRCRMNDNSRRWYISITPSGNQDPGTSADHDFYTAVVGTDRGYNMDDRLPPVDDWTRCSGNFGIDPGPTISWIHDSSPMAVDDRDDTLAVADDSDINDDSFNSVPSTPVNESFESQNDSLTFTSI